MDKITIDTIINDPYVKSYLDMADKNFAAIGYKEHGLRHAGFTSNIAGKTLECLGAPERDIELARIAGYLHDIGNSIEQSQHSFSGAIITKRILERLHMDYKEIMAVVSAVGTHEAKDIMPNSNITAAVIFGDKSDVHHTRIRTQKFADLDKHAKVNLACESSVLAVDAALKTISLKLGVDTDIVDMGEYFEIFLERLLQLKKSAAFFGYSFVLYINEEKFM